MRPGFGPIFLCLVAMQRNDMPQVIVYANLESAPIRACDAAVSAFDTQECTPSSGAVPYTGSVLYGTFLLSSTEACASLCAGSALQECEAFIFCRNNLRCILLTSVKEDAEDHSPYPGSCDAGRPCAGTCINQDDEVARIFNVSNCTDLVIRYGEKSSCVFSLADSEGYIGPDLGFVRALCPATCGACAGAGVAEKLYQDNRPLLAPAVASSLATAYVSSAHDCGIEENTIYPGASLGGSMLFWRSVPSTDMCASVCAAKAACTSFLFNKTVGDCALFNDSSPIVRGNTTREHDECCDFGLACAALCVNHDTYVAAQFQGNQMGHVGNCEEYVTFELLTFKVASCHELPTFDFIHRVEVIEGLCSLSCYVRRGQRNVIDVGTTTINTPPTQLPTSLPTDAPTDIVTLEPTSSKPLTVLPTSLPTPAPTNIVTSGATISAPLTALPTFLPTVAPTNIVTLEATITSLPTFFPTAAPTNIVTLGATINTPLTAMPTFLPTAAPTNIVTLGATINTPLTALPTFLPTAAPTNIVTLGATISTPLAAAPTFLPTAAPTNTVTFEVTDISGGPTHILSHVLQPTPASPSRIEIFGGLFQSSMRLPTNASAADPPSGPLTALPTPALAVPLVAAPTRLPTLTSPAATPVAAPMPAQTPSAETDTPTLLSPAVTGTPSSVTTPAPTSMPATTNAATLHVADTEENNENSILAVVAIGLIFFTLPLLFCLIGIQCCIWGRRARGAKIAPSAVASEPEQPNEPHPWLWSEQEEPSDLGESHKTFEETRFWAMSSTAQAVTEIHEGYGHIRNFLNAISDRYGFDTPSVRRYMDEVKGDMQSRAAGKLTNMADFAAVLWTMKHTLFDGENDRTIHSFINEALREDSEPYVDKVVPVVRIINALIVTNPGISYALTWPPENTTYRGIGMPLWARQFFTMGKVYRAPMFLATSFRRCAAEKFMDLSSSGDRRPTMLMFHFDPMLKYRHVILLENATAIKGDAEFLMPPYSGFQVLLAQWSETKVSELHIRVFSNNLHKDLTNVPLAPWH